MQPIAIPAKDHCSCYCLSIFQVSVISFIGVLAKGDYLRNYFIPSFETPDRKGDRYMSQLQQ